MDALSSKLKFWTASFADPRLFQIFSLGTLLAAGAYFRDFSIRPEQVVLTFAAGDAEKLRSIVAKFVEMRAARA